MNDRPLLDKNLDGDSFRKWYWLKEELVDFCRENGIPASGGKTDITDRIAHFLDTGEVKKADAVKAYFDIKQKAKTEKTSIDGQFEYNTYIRDFFEHNKGRSLDDAIKCWKYKKSMPGHNRYEDKDLEVL